MMYKAILFDFDGVLCRDRFYTRTLFPEHKSVLDWIEVNIFGNTPLVEQWMRGEMSSEEINRIIAEACAIEFELLHEKFLESVRCMQLDIQVKKIVQRLKTQGVTVGLVTNNMDVFSDITVANHKLDKLFHVIVNSSDYGMLKKDDTGKLFDIALEKLGFDIQDSLVVDDSSIVINLYKNKGGAVFLYRQSGELENFLYTN